jgi:hypothetical protein
MMRSDHKLLLDRLTRVAASVSGAGFANFAPWITPFLHAWTHVRVSALAFRINEAWHGRAVTVVLTDDPNAPWPAAANDRVFAGTRILTMDQLPDLLEDVVQGTIALSRSPLADALTLKSGGDPFRARSASPCDARYQHANRSHERFYRFEASWEADGNLASLFDLPGDAYTWYEDAQRGFEVLGQGTVADVARRLEITEHRDGLYWDRRSFLNLYAPVPIAFSHISQSADRTTIEVNLLRGTQIVAADLAVSVEATDSPTDRHQRIVAPETDSIRFASPTAGEATFQIVYKGQRIQREAASVLAPLVGNVRMAALSRFEDSDILGAGLDQGQRKREDLDEDAFERSVSHLLSLLGFSVFWWGPHKTHKTKGKKLPMPDDKADLLACSADDSVVLVVDCTLQPNQDSKAVKLFRRAREIENSVRKASGSSAPRVEPVLAIGVPREEVAQVLRHPEHDSEITVLALDEMKKALEGLRLGRPHEEICRDLPEAMGCGLRATGRFRLWPADVF